jgi:hypothetical protein
MPTGFVSTTLSAPSLPYDEGSAEEVGAVQIPESLPRLLYIGDVPVTGTIGGAALLHRVLQGYPADRLMIVQGNLWSNQQQWGNNDPTKRLRNVDYETLAVGNLRLLYSRFGRAYSGVLRITASMRSRKLESIIKSFRPEAILTAIHGFSWITAARVAAKYEIPLHLIIHDDWTEGNQLPKGIRSWADKQFKNIYQQAVSRLCASPYMVGAYAQQYGIRGSVLYPSRGRNDLAFDTACDTPSSRFPAFAYAGSINSAGYAKSILDLARVLEVSSGTVLLFTPHSNSELAALGLEKQNIIASPLITQDQLTTRLRELADVLFVPMTFEANQRANMIAGFPSKITDYTATGRPILICGPSYCSAVRWALENPGVAEVVSEDDQKLLAISVAKLISNRDYRRQLGSAALTIGKEHFSHAAVTEKFYRSIT